MKIFLTSILKLYQKNDFENIVEMFSSEVYITNKEQNEKIQIIRGDVKNQEKSIINHFQITYFGSNDFNMELVINSINYSSEFKVILNDFGFKKYQPSGFKNNINTTSILNHFYKENSNTNITYIENLQHSSICIFCSKHKVDFKQ